MPENLKTNNLKVSTSSRQIIKIALPIALAMMVPQLNFIANTIFLSHLGETELAAAGITGVYYLVFALIGNGLNSGLQALMSRRAGENKPQEIGRLFFQALYIASFFFVILIAFNIFLIDSLFPSLLKSEEVQKEAIAFLKIRIWGLPFLYFFQIANALLVGTNNSKYLKYGFTAMALINILFDYCFIFGSLGFPRLGFEGAAYASILAELVGMLVAFYIIYSKGFIKQFALLRYKLFDKKTVSIIFSQSLPLMIEFVLSIGGWLLFYVLIEHMGERELAISNTMRNIFAVFGIFTWSYANTTNMMVSNIIGQQLLDDVLPVVRKIARLSFFTVAVVSLLLNLFPQAFLSIYAASPEFIMEALPVVRTISISLLTMSIAVVWLNSITGTGNTKINLVIEFITILLYCFYVYIVTEKLRLPLVYVWASEFLYWFTTFILACTYMRSGRWKFKDVWK